MARPQKFTTWIGGRRAPQPLQEIASKLQNDLGVQLEVVDKNFDAGGFALLKSFSKEDAWRCWDGLQQLGVYLGQAPGPQVDAWLHVSYICFIVSNFCVETSTRFGLAGVARPPLGAAASTPWRSR